MARLIAFTKHAPLMKKDLLPFETMAGVISTAESTKGTRMASKNPGDDHRFTLNFGGHEVDE